LLLILPRQLVIDGGDQQGGRQREGTLGKGGDEGRSTRGKKATLSSSKWGGIELRNEWEKGKIDHIIAQS